MVKQSALTDQVIRQAKRPGVLVDGMGLRIRVSQHSRGSTLRKVWVLRVTLLTGKTKDVGLGSAYDVGLKEARDKARAVREEVRAGRDPIVERRRRQQVAAAEAARAISFRDCAKEMIDKYKPTWKNRKHAQQWVNTLETYAFPTLGAVAVADIDKGMVLKVIKPIWVKKTETANRVRSRIEAVLDYAKSHGYRSGENPAAWRGNLQHALPMVSRARAIRHHAAIPYGEMPEFFKTLGDRDGVSAACLKFLILTCARYSEATGAMWSEIDLVGRCWTIPAERMKAHRAHACHCLTRLSKSSKVGSSFG